MTADEQREFRLTTSDVAGRLGVDRSTVYRMAEGRLIRWRKTPRGHRRYHPDEVERVRAALAHGQALTPIPDEDW